jgi:quercetin dioxygenase-like cupin family protein
MKSVRCSDGAVEVIEVPTPAHGGVRVRVRSAGICGSDLHLIAGGMDLPHTLGHEMAGVLSDGREVAIEPLAPCGECDLCATDAYNLCRAGAGMILGVGIDSFFTQTDSVERLELTRHDERLSIEKPKGSKSARLNYKYEALSYRLKGKKMEPFMVEFDTEATNNPVPLAHGGEEFCFCIEGEIEFSSDQQTIRLTPGDSLYYFSDIPHALKGIGPGVPKALFVLLPEEDEGTE